MTMPVEQVRALVRLLYPDHMTPVAKRQIESACDAASEAPWCDWCGTAIFTMHGRVWSDRHGEMTCEANTDDHTHEPANQWLGAAGDAQPSLSVTATNDASTASPIATDTPSALREKTK